MMILSIIIIKFKLNKSTKLNTKLLRKKSTKYVEFLKFDSSCVRIKLMSLVNDHRILNFFIKSVYFKISDKDTKEHQ